MYELIINNGGLIQPVVLDGVTWENDRALSPGKLEFKLLNTKDLVIAEGNAVRFKMDGVGVFYGFIFRLTYSANTVAVTAYDQRRYLKNKDTQTFKKLTADGIVRLIADQFNLKVGTLAHTGYVIPPRIESNTTLADMIKTSLDITLRNTKKLYILDDLYGKLVLRDIETLTTNLYLDGDVLSDFTFESSIDQNTYNRIKLTKENEKAKKREVYISEDSSTQKIWGVLQYHDTLKDGENGQAKADALLALYNKRTHGFSAKNVKGNLAVVPGARIAVGVELGSQTITEYMVVDKVKHTFKDNQHLMDLDLIGGKA